MNEIFARGKKIFLEPSSSVLSAASIIMLMIVASSILGLVRQRVLANFFNANDLSLFFAAFRIPDTIFEILVFGTFSSSFIPVFTRSLKEGTHQAWQIASTIVNLGLLVFITFAILISLSARSLYGIITPGFSAPEVARVAELVRILVFAQVFFVVSFVLTGVLESLRRFLAPALAPIFYNLGIIFGTILFAGKYGLMAPAMGVVIGAFLHFIIQLPLAVKLGFKFSLRIRLSDEVRKIGRLAVPRLVEITFTQVAKNVELLLASLISTGAYTFFTFANSLQTFPISLFGTSIAKAALPTLSAQVDNYPNFRKTLLSSFNQMLFAVMPISIFLAVLRIPVVRLVFGTSIFTWESTVQTSLTLSAFAVGITFQAAVGLLARGFYALHDTKTPVIISISTLIANIMMDVVFIRVLHLPVWGLAAAFSIGNIFESAVLYILLLKRIGDGMFWKETLPILKIFAASAVSGGVMYTILKFFDRYAWVQRISFLTKSPAIPFEKFVLDTRYTVNLLILTVIVSGVGALVYIGISLFIGNREVYGLFAAIKRMFIKGQVAGVPVKEQEPITPTPEGSTPN
jgi:putative peptidoglycan lipid II flippase